MCCISRIHFVHVDIVMSKIKPEMVHKRQKCGIVEVHGSTFAKPNVKPNNSTTFWTNAYCSKECVTLAIDWLLFAVRLWLHL